MVHTINSTPSMDAAGLAYFKRAVNRSQCYLEYGSGGSTVYACQVAHVQTVISVESDQLWADSVRSSLKDYQSNLLMQHCDLGPVGEWGTPLDLNYASVSKFWNYMVLPWNAAKTGHHVPDTVLIDGRFRVATFLYSLLSSPEGTTIMFDDYCNRSYYSVVEEFCEVKERHGRMAVFVVAHGYSMTSLVARIAEYSVRWD